MDLRKLVESLKGAPLPYVKPPPKICERCPTRVIRPGATLCTPCERNARREPGVVIEAQLGSAHWAQPKPLPVMDYSPKAVVRKIKKMKLHRSATKRRVREAMVQLGGPATLLQISAACGLNYLTTAYHVKTIARHVGSAPGNRKKPQYLWQL